MSGGFLIAEERASLKAVMRQPSKVHGVAPCDNALLLLNDGLSCTEVGKVLYHDADSVRTWQKHYGAGVLDELTLLDWHRCLDHLSRVEGVALSASLGSALPRQGRCGGQVRRAYGASLQTDGPHQATLLASLCSSPQCHRAIAGDVRRAATRDYSYFSRPE